MSVVDGIVTGWHEPDASHLLMLEAIAGRDLVERSYDAALAGGYRWHEFGDSHLLLPPEAGRSPLMRAIVLSEFGPAENLRLEDVEDPQPGPGQARIAVTVAGVHFIDTKLRQGGPMGLLPQPELPAIPGREVAGVVDAVGPDVDESWSAAAWWPTSGRRAAATPRWRCARSRRCTCCRTGSPTTPQSR